MSARGAPAVGPSASPGVRRPLRSIDHTRSSPQFSCCSGGPGVWIGPCYGMDRVQIGESGPDITDGPLVGAARQRTIPGWLSEMLHLH